MLKELELTSIEDLQQDMQVCKEDFEVIYRTCIVMESLVELHDSIQAKGSISQEDLKLIRIGLQMATAGTNVSTESLFPSLEDYSDVNIACEGLLDVIIRSLHAIAQSLVQSIRSYVDQVQASWVMFELQSNKLNSIKKNLTGQVKPEVKVKKGKYLMYGKGHMVKDIPEYTKHYVEAMGDMKQLLTLVAVLQEKDFMQSLKTLISPITGYNKKFMEMFKTFYKFLQGVRDITFYRPGVIPGRYVSDSYLGLSHIMVSQPDTIVNDDNIQMCKRVFDEFEVAFVRDSKFEIETLHSSVVLSGVNVNDVHKLITSTEEVILAYKRLMTLTNRLSNLGARNMAFDYAMTTIDSRGIASAKLLLDNYRLLAKTSVVISNTTNTAFNFTRGNIAKCLEILSKVSV